MVSLFKGGRNGQSNISPVSDGGYVSAFISVRKSGFCPGCNDRDFISRMSFVIVAENNRVWRP